LEAYCFGPQGFELELSPEFTGPIELISFQGVQVLLNGVAILPTSIYTSGTHAVFILNQTIRPADALKVKLLGVDVDASQKPLLSSLIPVANTLLDYSRSISSRAFHKSTEVSPLSGEGSYRPYLSNASIKDSLTTTPWTRTPFTHTNFLGQISDHTRIFIDNSGSKISSDILVDSNPGRMGETITCSVQMKTPQGVGAVIEIIGSSIATSSVFTSDDWVQHSLSYTLPQVSPLSVSLSATRIGLSEKPYACFRNLEVSSDWRGILFQDPLKSATQWVVSGSAIPGSDAFDIATWRELFLPGQLSASCAILSNDRLTITPLP